VVFNHWYNKVNQRVYQTASDNSYWSYPTASASSVSYSANNLNQYTAVGSASPTYDGNGNLTSDGTFTYGYDAENRLISASGSGNTVSYAYDASGRRKSKTVNGISTYTLSDGDREVLESDGSGNVLRRYTHGAGIDEVLNLVNANGTRAILVPDIQGSLIASVDSTSGTITQQGVQAYGESASATGSFRYTGRRIDAETLGLYYYRARMHAPGFGRFMQPARAPANREARRPSSGGRPRLAARASPPTDHARSCRDRPRPVSRRGAAPGRCRGTSCRRRGSSCGARRRFPAGTA